MSIYQQNLKLFKSIAPTIYFGLKQGRPQFPLQARRAAEGNIEAERDGVRCLLHSSYSIDKEMESMFAGVGEDCEILVIFGFGDGHFLPYIASRFKDVKQIVIIEPSLQLFDLVLHERDLSKFIRVPRQTKLSFVINQTVETTLAMVKPVLKYSSKIAFAPHLSYRALYSGYYQSFCDALGEWFRLQRLELRTYQCALQMWLENTVKNLAISAYPCEIIQDLFDGKPAIIVSAGPSLEKHIHLLAEARDKAVIVAVGTAIKILDKAGVRPHFYAAADAEGVEKTRVFDHLTTTDVPLLFYNQLQPDITANYSGPLIRIVKHDDNLTQFIYGLAEKLLIVPTSGYSIANMILDFLCKMGCSSVIFIGQDMCFQGDKVHAEGGDMVEDALRPQLLTVQDIYGQEVQTLPNYWAIKSAMETIVSWYPKMKFINATEGGLGVAGAENRRFADVLAELAPLAGDVSQSLAKILTDRVDECQEFSRYFGHEDFIPLLTEIVTISGQTIELAQEIAALMRDKADRDCIEKKISILEKYQNDLEKNKFYKQVIAPMLNTLLETFTNIYQGKATAADWDTRAEAIISEKVSKAVELRYFCDLVMKHLSKAAERV